MGRRPPTKIRKILRKEVGFGCPVPDCGRPYLEWHHFDPPWHIVNHNNPKGMIALCREYHIQGDNGAFTKEQLHNFKKNGKNNWNKIKGNFNWLRNKILVAVADNYYYDIPVAVKYKGEPLIWFNRNPEGYLLLNLNILSTSGKPRAYVRDNEWFNVGGEEDIECPPSAKKLAIEYPNGDRLKLEYFEILNMEEAYKRYTVDLSGDKNIGYPITSVEITIDVGASDLHIIPSKAILGANVSGCLVSRCDVGLSIS